MTNRIEGFLIQSQIVVAAAMTGIIWFVQRITYPQFLDANPTGFSDFHERYTASLTPIVAPLMISELALSLAAVWFFRHTPLRNLVVLASLTTGVLWSATFLVHVPLHERLSIGWSEPGIRELIHTNWIRTALWSARLVLLLCIGSKLSLTGKPRG